MGHQYQSDRGHSATFERWETDHNCSGGTRDIRTPEYGGAKKTSYRGQSPSIKCRQSEPQCLLQNPVAHPVRRSDFAVRKAHCGETKISGETGIIGDAINRAHTHETITGRDPGVRSDFGVHSHGMGAAPSRRAGSPVMRVQPTSVESDIRVSHTACDTPKKGLDIAAMSCRRYLWEKM